MSRTPLAQISRSLVVLALPLAACTSSVSADPTTTSVTVSATVTTEAPMTTVEQTASSEGISLEQYEALVEAAADELKEVQDEVLFTDPGLREVEGLFTIAQAYVDVIAAIPPPGELRAAHEGWVQTAAEIQSVVRAFLDESDEESFSLARLDARIGTLGNDHVAACRQLRSAAADAGLDLDPGCLGR